MTQTAQALYSFFSSFGIPAYTEYSMPDEAAMPYITYELAEPYWKGKMAIHARIWYRRPSFTEVSAKVDEIREALGEGVSIQTNNGAVYLFPDDNFVQFMPQEDPSIKCAYLSFIIHAET